MRSFVFQHQNQLDGDIEDLGAIENRDKLTVLNS